MKKQEYFDIGIQSGLTPGQIEKVLCRVLNISKEELFKLKDISSRFIYDVQKDFYNLQSGEPEAYTLEKTDFYGREFFIDERVLIPRNDTETLVREALLKINLLVDTSQMVYLDVGTGSGCIPISIISEMYPLRFKKIFGLDISSDALEVAKENEQAHCPKRIEFRQSDLLAGIFHEESLVGKDLFITANLPYIKQGDHANMDASVIDYEPKNALYGGSETGFELYEKLIKQCFQMKQIHKLGNIHMFIEIGFDQYNHSKRFLEDLGLGFEYFSDSNNIQRVISIEGF